MTTRGGKKAQGRARQCTSTCGMPPSPSGSPCSSRCEYILDGDAITIAKVKRQEKEVDTHIPREDAAHRSRPTFSINYSLYKSIRQPRSHLAPSHTHTHPTGSRYKYSCRPAGVPWPCDQACLRRRRCIRRDGSEAVADRPVPRYRRATP